MSATELQRIEESPRLDERINMIENRCLRCGEGWFVGSCDPGHVAWGLFMCDPCRRKKRIEDTLVRLDAGFRRGLLDDRLLRLRQRLHEVAR